MIYAAAYENQPITPMNCHIIEPSTMSHGDWQSWDIFMVIMVIIMSHNHIKLFNCFADEGMADQEKGHEMLGHDTNRPCAMLETPFV